MSVTPLPRAVNIVAAAAATTSLLQNYAHQQLQLAPDQKPPVVISPTSPLSLGSGDVNSRRVADDDDDDDDDSRNGCYDDVTMAHAAGGFGVCLPTSASRRNREFIPDSKKDEEYWMKRQKNNEAAKRSREKRRANDAVMAHRIHELTAENKRLKLELIAIRRQFGLVPGSYVLPPENAGSPSDDGTTSPIKSNSLLSGHEIPSSGQGAGIENHHQRQKSALTRAGQQTTGSEASHQYRLDYSSRPGTGSTDAISVGSRKLTSEAAYSLPNHFGLSGDLLYAPPAAELAKLQSLESVNSNRSAAEDDNHRFLSYSNSLTAVNHVNSRRSSDCVSLVLSEVSSGDSNGDYYDYDKPDHVMPPYARPADLMTSSCHQLQLKDNVDGRCIAPAATTTTTLTTCETPLNLSSVPSSQFCFSSVDAAHDRSAATSAVNRLHTSADLWQRRPLSPNGVKYEDVDDDSMTSNRFDDRSVVAPSETGAIHHVGDAVHDRHGCAQQSSSKSGPIVVAPVSNSTASILLPSLASFQRPINRLSVDSPSPSDTEVKWPPMSPLPSAQPAAGSQQLSSLQRHGDEQDVVVSSSNNGRNSRQVRGGVPLKVWHKRAAGLLADVDAVASSDCAADEVLVRDLKRPPSDWHERRALSLDGAPFEVIRSSGDCGNTSPDATSSATRTNILRAFPLRSLPIFSPVSATDAHLRTSGLVTSQSNNNSCLTLPSSRDGESRSHDNL